MLKFKSDKLWNLILYPLEVVSRYRDSQLQVDKNYFHLYNWNQSISQSCQSAYFMCCFNVSYIRSEGPRVVVRTAAFHARVRGSFPGLGGLKETNMFLLHPLVKLSIVGSLCDREVACSASDLQGLNFVFCVWRAGGSPGPKPVCARKWPKARFISILSNIRPTLFRCITVEYMFGTLLNTYYTMVLTM